MIIFSLKKKWYEKIKSGEKTVEYREVKPYWANRIFNYKYRYAEFLKPQERAEFLAKYPTIFKRERAVCRIRLGYTNQYMAAIIKKIEIVDGKNTDLRLNKPVFAIHFADAVEIKSKDIRGGVKNDKERAC